MIDLPIVSRKLYEAYKAWRDLPNREVSYQDFDHFAYRRGWVRQSFENLELCHLHWKRARQQSRTLNPGELPGSMEWILARISDYEKAHPGVWARAKSLMTWTVR